MDKRKLILSREYFSIQRAAEILGCTTDDIEHYIEIKAIGAYIRFNGYRSQGEILLKELEKWTIEHCSCPDERIQEIIKTHCSWVNFVEIVNNDSEMLLTINCSLYGLWMLDFETVICLLLDLPLHAAYVAPVQQYDQRPTSELKTALPIVNGFNAPEDIQKSDIQILRHDLLHLYDSLHGESGTLANIYNNEELCNTMLEKMQSERAPRTEPRQSDVIMALLHVLPELKKDMDNKPSQASAFLDDFLIGKGLNPVRMSQKSYANYKKTAKYKP